MATSTLWPVPIPAWFWVWARWYLGHDEFEGHQQDPKLRPKGAPETIPYWAWARLMVLLDKPIPPPPPEPPVKIDPSLIKARAILKDAKRFHGPYLYGAEHDLTFNDDDFGDPFDCSSSCSYLKHRHGILGSSFAQVSDWFERWGQPGRGKYLTTHANDEHVWMEFNLPEGYYRFDTSPHACGERGPRVRTCRRFDSTFVHRHYPGL